MPDFLEADLRVIELLRDFPPDEWPGAELWEGAEVPFEHDEEQASLDELEAERHLAPGRWGND